MNYFRCTVGGSGKGNTVTVTCAEEFAGLTITLSKTGKTYTKTCPSTSPYVVTFYGVENGTYTVNATYGGRTYSESVVVKNIDCVLNYGFGWVTWVNTAQYLDASDYASLDEVLEDEAAIRELFLEHACVDYMAELTNSNEDLETVINNDLCAKWINNSDYALDFLGANTVIKALMDEADKYGYGEWALMPQVPTMTSNTAPYGSCIGTSSKSGNEWYKAFDGNDSTEAVAETNTTSTAGSYIGYRFTNPICVKKVHLYCSSSSTTYSATIQASNDGSNWIDISEEFTITPPNTNMDVALDNNDNFLYYRIIRKNTTSTAVYFSFYTIQFYAWAPKGNVPIMTSNTAPYGVAAASNTYSSYSPYYAFNGILTNSWHAAENVTNNRLQYKFTNPINAKRLSIVFGSDAASGSTNTFKVQGSNDGTTWVDLSTIQLVASGTSAVRNIFEADFDNDDYYMYYAIFSAQGTYVNKYWAIAQLQFYGRELKVSVPTMTSNTAPYGAVVGSNLTNTSIYALKAFNGVADTSSSRNYAAVTTANGAGYIGYKFVHPVVCKGMYWYGNSNSSTSIYYLTSGDIKYSDDGATWTTVKELRNQTGKAAGSCFYHEIENETPHLYWALFPISAVSSSGDYNFYCNRMQFFGLDYSEKEFEVGTTKKWLYDHGVELEVINTVCQNASYADDLEKTDYCLRNRGTHSGNYAIGFITASQYDITPFNLLRARLGDVLVTRMGIGVRNTIPYYGDNVAPAASVQYTPSNANLPNNLNLNVSNVNQNEYIHIGQTADYSKYEVEELWLE